MGALRIPVCWTLGEIEEAALQAMGIKREGKVGFAVQWRPNNHQVSIEVPCG